MFRLMSNPKSTHYNPDVAKALKDAAGKDDEQKTGGKDGDKKKKGRGGGSVGQKAKRKSRSKAKNGKGKGRKGKRRGKNGHVMVKTTMKTKMPMAWKMTMQRTQLACIITSVSNQNTHFLILHPYKFCTRTVHFDDKLASGIRWSHRR